MRILVLQEQDRIEDFPRRKSSRTPSLPGQNPALRPLPCRPPEDLHQHWEPAPGQRMVDAGARPLEEQPAEIVQEVSLRGVAAER